MKQPAKLRELVAAEGLLMIPGVYDSITAHLVQKAGFSAAYATGSGISMTLTGQPDLNTVSYIELKDKVDNLLSVLDIPLIVDIDTGFGGPLNAIRLLRDFERIGVAAVQIEDQVSPKRCGHEMGRSVVSAKEMKLRIRSLADHRTAEDGIMIIARTDSRTSLGIDEAIRRGNAYLEAGADVIFVESPESEEEARRIAREIQGPALFNNVEGGRSPFLARSVLEDAGFAAAIYPNALTRIMVKSAQRLLAELKANGTTEALWDEMMTHREMFAAFDHDGWVALEKQYLI